MAALSLAIEKKIEVIVLRPFEVFGEGQHESLFWPSLQKAALAGEDFAMTAGEQFRDRRMSDRWLSRTRAPSRAWLRR